MILDPDPTTLNCCENYFFGLLRHLQGKQPSAAKTYYEHSLKGRHDKARTYISWIDNNIDVKSPISLPDIDDHKQLSMFVEDYKKQVNVSVSKERGLTLVCELASYRKPPSGYLCHSLKMLADISAVGSSYSDLRTCIGRVGPIHNILDRHGIPKPGELRERSSADPSGWMTVDQVEFRQGQASIIGSVSDRLVPLVMQDDVDVALWLAYFEGSEPVSPSFSLDRAGDGEVHRRLDRKTFEPKWLANTAFGQSMYFADWLMKSFTMRDGLPSIHDPCVSGACVGSWKPPAMMIAIADADGDHTLPDGTEAEHSRLEIVVRGTSLSRAHFRQAFFFPVDQYRIDHIDVFVESSLMTYNTNGIDSYNSRKHYRHNDPTTTSGARAHLITSNYEYVGDMFPVFSRVRYLLGLYSLFCRARKDGVSVSSSERNRISRKIEGYKQKFTSTRLSIEFSPKQFHKNGCYCNGGVSGRPDAQVTHTQSNAFKEEPRKIDFIVTSGGSSFPVPDNATGPHSIPSGAGGMIFSGGSGGKGMHSSTSEVWFMDANRNQGARTYYKNSIGQKVDPFTGKSVDRNNPWAHIYHD